MKTIVFQSFRAERVPDWVEACMASVRSWAAARGYDYRFMDDSFLELAPTWYRERCAGEICPVTDLARLLVARDLLAGGWDRTVWVDADMLVFAPRHLSVDGVDGFAFCLEVWSSAGPDGRVQCVRRVNNSISVFTRGNRQVDFFIDACLRIAAAKGRVSKLDVGTQFLTGLAGLMPMPLLANVGTFSPLVVCDIAAGGDRVVPAYAAHLPAPLACANLCQSLVGKAMEGWRADDDACGLAVERCLATQGGVVNRHVTPQAAR